MSDPGNVPNAVRVSPEYSNFGTISADSRNTSAMVIGATPAYLTIHNHTLTQGEFIDDSQTTKMASVAVLGAQVATKLFPDQDPIGQDATSAQIAATLRERHRLTPGEDVDDFSIDNQQDLIKTLSDSQRTMTLFMGSIAAISLIVGGIGIMNIMLVSVRERTCEIGLRKAIGARERDILTQFLIEALTLSTCGGLIGLLIGALIAVIANQSGQSRATVTPESVVLAFGFALVIGLSFGIEPARRAARLDPIVALRYE